IFKNVVAANHESNALAVANRQVDVATCNNEAISRLEIAHPEKAAQIREIWRSPLIPSDPLVWRNSLPESTKKKIADFIFGYGVKGDVAHAKAILEKLQWGRSSLRPTPSSFLSASSNCSAKRASWRPTPRCLRRKRPSASRRLTKPSTSCPCNTLRRRGGFRAV